MKKVFFTLLFALLMVGCSNPVTGPSSGRPKGYLDWNTTAPGCSPNKGAIVMGQATYVSPMIRDGALYGLPQFKNFVIVKWPTLNVGEVTALFLLMDDEAFGICMWFTTQ